jgi:hypothetical protein
MILLGGTLLDVCTSNLVYLENLLIFFIKARGKEKFPEIKGSKMQLPIGGSPKAFSGKGIEAPAVWFGLCRDVHKVSLPFLCTFLPSVTEYLQSDLAFTGLKVT